MKRTFLLFACLIATLFLQAQSFRFADSTSQWNILEHQWGWFPSGEFYYTHVFKTDGDTLINGKNYQRISSAYYQPNFLRRDSANRIFLNYNNGDIMIYNFGAVAGDSITGLGQYGFGNADIGCKVDSVDTVNWNGVKKRMYVNCTSNLGQYQDVWVDGVGSLNNHSIWGGADIIVVDGPEYSLLCYFEDGQLQYHDNLYDTCMYQSPTAVLPVEEQQLSFYPNPAADVVALTLADNIPGAMLEVLNACGELVRTQPVETSKSYLPVYNLPDGMYYLLLKKPDGSKASGKLVVLHP